MREGQQQSPNWRDAPGRGRRAALHGVQAQSARRSAKAGVPVSKVAARLSRAVGQSISAKQVRSALQRGSHPLQWLPERRGRQLSAANAAARLEWCRANIRCRAGDLLFADSKFLYLYKDHTGSVRWRWQDPARQAPLPRVSNPLVLHFYAVVGQRCKSDLIFVALTPPLDSNRKKATETFSSQHFIEAAAAMRRTIEAWGKGSSRYRLVLDNAKQHTSSASKQAMSGMGLHLLPGFPAQSWDLNIIENVWGVLVTKLHTMRGRYPTTVRGWVKRTRQAWRAIDQATIDKLVTTFRDRMRDVVKHKGAWPSKHK